jgi:hypothetical protein
MNQFVINRPIGFENSIKTIVKQSFPFATPNELALEATEKGFRGGALQYSTQVPGSKRERFVWGMSRMGSSRIVG